MPGYAGLPQFFSLREPLMGRGLTPKLHEIIRKIRARDREIRFLEPSGAFIMPNR
jgi:hypothetical protein